MNEVTIVPTEEYARLRVREDRTHPTLARDVVVRWLERAARRKGRHINVPSVVMLVDCDPARRQTFLYAWADSFPYSLPDWLRYKRIDT